MSRLPRRNHAPAFKARVALVAIKGDLTLADLLARQRLRRVPVAQRQIRGGVSAGPRNGGCARTSLTRYFGFYNTVRPPSALGNLPPAIYAKLSVPVMQRDGLYSRLDETWGSSNWP